MTGVLAEKSVIALGSDHGGYALKESIKEHLVKMGFDVHDFGTNDSRSCDYPVFAELVGTAVADGSACKGILVCGTGIGVSIAANKINGIRAALVHDVTTARLAAEHNDANVMCLGGRLVAAPLALEMVDVWLHTAFETRHQRRLDMIQSLEQR